MVSCIGEPPATFQVKGFETIFAGMDVQPTQTYGILDPAPGGFAFGPARATGIRQPNAAKAPREVDGGAAREEAPPPTPRSHPSGRRGEALAAAWSAAGAPARR